MTLKLGVLAEEYILALTKTCEYEIKHSDYPESKKQELLTQAIDLIDNEFKGRRPRVLLDYNDDFYFCVGIKSDYKNTFHSDRYYNNSKELKALIYHYKHPISRNEKTKYPYLKFDTGILVPKKAVYSLDKDRIAAIEQLTSPLISATDMLSNNLNYIESHSDEIEAAMKTYCGNADSIKHGVEKYWRYLRRIGMRKYAGGFLAKGFLANRNLDLEFHEKVKEYYSDLDRLWETGHLEIADENLANSKDNIADRKADNNRYRTIDTNSGVDYRFLNNIAHIPQIYKLKKLSALEKKTAKASPFEHILAATMIAKEDEISNISNNSQTVQKTSMSVVSEEKRINAEPPGLILTRKEKAKRESKRDSLITDDKKFQNQHIKRKSDYLMLKTNNMRILEEQKNNSRYILENTKQKGKYGAIIFTNIKKDKVQPIHKVNKNLFIDKLINNTPFISYVQSRRPSFVYFSVPNKKINTEINKNDSNNEKMNKIISSFIISYKLPFNEELGIFEGIQDAKYTMYDAISMNDRTLNFQLMHFLVLTEINKRTNLNFDCPSYPLLQKHYFQAISHSAALNECARDANSICNNIFAQVPELIFEKNGKNTKKAVERKEVAIVSASKELNELSKD